LFGQEAININYLIAVKLIIKLKELIIKKVRAVWSTHPSSGG